jgi:membrane fusion protein, multidrug efflux system
MQKLVTIVLIAAIFSLTACGAKKAGNELADKKAQLETLKAQQSKLNDQIVALQAEIVTLDPSSAQEKAKLVSLDTLKTMPFTHYIDLQGRVTAENIVYVTPRGQGGQVKELYIKQGDAVSKGELLMKLDDAIIRQQIAQTQTQLDYAKDLYQRRENLWKENIGTQVDVINAKNNVDQAQKQMDLLNEQLGFTNVYAPIDGVADQVTIRIGEVFGGVGGGGIELVNTSALKVTVQVPENYLDKVNVGGNILVNLPDINKTIPAVITVKSKLVDANTGSFYVEAHLPNDKDLHPNQTALVKIQDYTAANSIVVPVNTVQNDQNGKFVLVAATENNKLVAKKRPVQIGQFYADNLEIKSGLQPGDMIIINGYEGLYDGQAISLTGE